MAVTFLVSLPLTQVIVFLTFETTGFGVGDADGDGEITSVGSGVGV